MVEPPKKNDTSDLSAFLGTARSDAEGAAVRFLIDYTDKLPLNRVVRPDREDQRIWSLRPDIDVLAGDDDSFNGFSAKLSAEGQRTNNLESVMPMDIVAFGGGVEADGDFRTVNALAEMGWGPILHSEKLGRWKVVPGVFLQGGYKFASDEAEPGETVTADNDESSEDKDDLLARGKALVSLESPRYKLLAGWGHGIDAQLVADAAVWYDMLENDVYHRVVGTVRFHLDEKKSFDLNYESGSGAPNFNEGDQFSAGLTIKF